MTCPPETLVHLSAPRGELNLTGPHTVSHIIGNSFRLLGKKKISKLGSQAKTFSARPVRIMLPSSCGVGKLWCRANGLQSFAGKRVLLEHCHGHSLMHCLRLLLS